MNRISGNATDLKLKLAHNGSLMLIGTVDSRHSRGRYEKHQFLRCAEDVRDVGTLLTGCAQHCCKCKCDQLFQWEISNFEPP